MQIRPYRTEDRAACVQVFHRAVREGTTAFYDAAQRAAWAGPPVPDLATPDPRAGQWCLVAEDAGRINGFFAMDPDGYLDMAFVLPEVMGKGVAAALYDALMAKARAHGLPRVHTHASHLFRRFLLRRGWHVVTPENHPAHGLIYERFVMALDLIPPHVAP